jgi:hypothetical protein
MLGVNAQFRSVSFPAKTLTISTRSRDMASSAPTPDRQRVALHVGSIEAVHQRLDGPGELLRRTVRPSVRAR